MKIVIAGGSGHVGASLLRHFSGQGHDLVVLSRAAASAQNGIRTVVWDAKNLGDWAKEIDGADVVINLAGRSVNCRYNATNLKVMMDSRVDSTRVVGLAIQKANMPPKLWLQSSTATIYAHRFDAPNDEITGILGIDEPGAPPKWNASIAIAKAWEAALYEFETPKTRKIAMRSAMTMSPETGSIFDVFSTLARRGLGGKQASGKQYVSWIHERDFCRAIDFLIEREDLEGSINLSSPEPLPQQEFSRILRETLGVKFGLPATKWMLEIGTALMKTETELVLKSRRVIPTRLLEAGFKFDFLGWKEACADLASLQKK